MGKITMYLIFRCDCGRALYAKEGVATRKCVCGKTLKVKSVKNDWNDTRDNYNINFNNTNRLSVNG